MENDSAFSDGGMSVVFYPDCLTVADEQMKAICLTKKESIALAKEVMRRYGLISAGIAVNEREVVCGS